MYTILNDAFAVWDNSHKNHKIESVDVSSLSPFVQVSRKSCRFQVGHDDILPIIITSLSIKQSLETKNVFYCFLAHQKN